MKRASWTALLSAAVALACASAPPPSPVAPQPKATPQRPPSDEPLIQLVDRYITQEKVDRSGPIWRENVPPAPLLPFDASRRYLWRLDTNQGPLLIELEPRRARVHASSTIYLTRLGFYDDLKFHRIIPGFMAQGGDPRGDGSGGPGYLYASEIDASLSHDRRGLLSMANRGPGTDGSQFFLLFNAQPHLDGKHTIFGSLVDGFDTLDRLEGLGSSSGTPREPVVIERASIEIRLR